MPVVFLAETSSPRRATLLFVLSVLAIVPLAALLSHATESVAAKTGDAVGGLLNATLGNLTELVIALTALRAGQYMLVKASIAGAIVTNVLFMLGASFLLGGLKHHTQEFNRVGARFQAGLLFLATVALLVPSATTKVDSPAARGVHAGAEPRSRGAADRHLRPRHALLAQDAPRVLRQRRGRGGRRGAMAAGVALATLAGVTVLVALVSEVFVESVQEAAETFGMTPAFVGFIVVALVGGAAEMASAFSGARKNRLDLSVGIALGSASQIALFVAPVLVLLSYVHRPVADEPAVLAGRGGHDADRHADRRAGDEQRPLGVVRRRAGADGLPDLCDDALLAAAGTREMAVHPGTASEHAATPVSADPPRSPKRVLEPIDRISEVLFGLIMVLTFTGSLSVAQAGRDDVRAMLIGALGCNLAWGIIDAVFYLMGCLAEKHRGLATFRAVRDARDPEQARACSRMRCRRWWRRSSNRRSWTRCVCA